MRSLREPKALTIQPMRCRSNQNMAEILSKRPQQNSFQVVHFTSARRFDDGHAGIVRSRRMFSRVQACVWFFPRARLVELSVRISALFDEVDQLDSSVPFA